jgi:integrase
MPDWVVHSKNGRISVSGTRCEIKGKLRDRLYWNDLDGKRHDTMLAVEADNPDRAKFHAQSIAEEAARGSASAELKRSDVLELFAARDALVRHGVSVDVACREYSAALDVLGKSGGSLSDAVRFFSDHHISESVSIEVCNEQFIHSLELKGRSLDYLSSSRKFCGRIQRAFPGREVKSFTTHELEVWLYHIAGKLAPKSFNNYLSAMVTVFNFAIKKGWCGVNPAGSIDKRTEKRSIEVYSRDDITRILNGLDPYFIPWVVLQCFGCLRAAEVARVKWGTNIKLDRDEPVIRVTEDVAKGSDGQPRIIYLQPNAVKWLEPWSLIRNERVYPGDYFKVLENLWNGLSLRRKEVGVQTLKNGLRKTCASNLAAIVPIHDAAEMMGHSLKKMKSNYQEMITRTEAEKYWAISPNNLNEEREAV